mmetsp:Transcript_22961/g.66459  ORF Transcript_22961/g.66459 Transcript_22961/m.66459 type:complete len:258 (-) Transcript_22961:293-1066(-)
MRGIYGVRARTADSFKARVCHGRPMSRMHVVWGGLDEDSSSDRHSWRQEARSEGSIQYLPSSHDGSSLTSSKANSAHGSQASFTGVSKHDASCPGSMAETGFSESELAQITEVLAATLGRQGLWSRGSAHHLLGRCKTCHYTHSAKGCANGSQCRFCHIPHTRDSCTKVCNFKRSRCSEIAEALASALPSDGEQFHKVAGALGVRSVYLQNALEERFKTGSSPSDPDDRPLAAPGAAPIAKGQHSAAAEGMPLKLSL